MKRARSLLKAPQTCGISLSLLGQPEQGPDGGVQLSPPARSQGLPQLMWLVQIVQASLVACTSSVDIGVAACCAPF